MADRVQQILKGAELLRTGDIASGMNLIQESTKHPPKQKALDILPLAAGDAPMGTDVAGAVDLQSPLLLASEGIALAGAEDKIDPARLRLAQTVGALRLRLIQEAAQQQYLAAYAQQVLEVQQQEAQLLHERQQEEAQLALIMEAAETQAAVAQQSLDEDKEELHWHRRAARQSVCGHWQRGHCGRGDACQFAHPAREKGTLQTRGHADIMRHNFKTSTCQFFSTGTCPHGDRCMFAHGPKDLRTPGAPLSKEEEEMVQRVATAKVSRSGATIPAAVPGTGATPAMVPPPPPGLPPQQAGAAALAGALVGLAAPPPPAADLGVALAAAEKELIKSSAQLMALAGLTAMPSGDALGALGALAGATPAAFQPPPPPPPQGRPAAIPGLQMRPPQRQVVPVLPGGVPAPPPLVALDASVADRSQDLADGDWMQRQLDAVRAVEGALGGDAKRPRVG